jgi:NAD-dependent dihydropyrimidine dehydrogenase PreA subunit
MHERPARWTLAALGCDLDRIGRIVRPLDGQSAEAFARALIAGTTFPIPAKPSACTTEPFDQPVASRWYPVIDYAVCSGCRQCLDFCLFGVYELGHNGRVVAAVPDNCKPGCPACSRVCPAGAIMFPHYEADPVIAGITPHAAPADTAVGSNQQSHSPLASAAAAAEAERAACSQGQGGDDAPERDGPPDGPPHDELDDLIDRLDRMDTA